MPFESVVSRTQYEVVCPTIKGIYLALNADPCKEVWHSREKAIDSHTKHANRIGTKELGLKVKIPPKGEKNVCHLKKICKPSDGAESCGRFLQFLKTLEKTSVLLF